MMRLTHAAIAISVFSMFILCASAFADGPWKGKIMDVETKEPLEGVVVLAVWNRIYRTPFGTSSYFYEAKETMTNKTGEFEIPSYTPINMLPLISYMQGPEFTIFKPGYGSLRMSLGEYLTTKAKKSDEFELSGKKFKLTPGVIELPRLKTIEERRSISTAPVGHEKDWKKQQLLIKAIREEWKNLTGKDPGKLYFMKEETK